jgi:hypothetical protein
MKTNPKDKLILDMLAMFERLGTDRTAQIDARLWRIVFHRRAAKLGLVKPKKRQPRYHQWRVECRLRDRSRHQDLWKPTKLSCAENPKDQAEAELMAANLNRTTHNFEYRAR